MPTALAKAFGKSEILLSAYLDGLAPVAELFPPPPTELEQAMGLEQSGHWSDASVGLAKALDAELRDKGKRLTPAEWVRQLDYLEDESRRTIRAIWERLLDEDDR